jgi:N utilization substance protein B
MVSRRNVRVKVLQTLYALSRDPAQTPVWAETFYRQKIGEPYRLYLYSLYLLVRINSYARKDSAIKASKFLPTEEDLLQSERLSDNPVALSLEKNNGFQDLLKKENLLSLPDPDLLRQVYYAFVKTDAVRAYLAEPSPSESAHVEILLKLLKFVFQHELVKEHLEDHFPNLLDDESLVLGAAKRTIKSLPANTDFYLDHAPDPEVVVDFGENLLYRTVRDDKELMDIIAPSLQNWDPERLAVLDMIILKMAVTEFLHCPTVPTKVTLNEYVDIAKEYSTPKSREFVNGVLDRLMKDLLESGRIVKEGRGLLE